MKVLLAAVLVLIAGVSSAWAVLGEYANSVASDQQRMHGQIREIVRQGYSVRQITAADGAVTNEYVSPAGMVFAVSWQGPFMPDLRQLLGSYFAQFQQAPRSSARRHSPMIVRTKQLVVVSGGHMRSFHGSAYVPSLVPANVSAEDLR
jgi:Protein of unknown function (DUF2844)